MGTVLAQQHFCTAQLAVVVVAHGRTVCTGIMDIDDIANVDLGQHTVDGKLVVVLAQTAHHIIHVVAGLVLLAQHSDVMVSAIHGGTHQVGSAGVQTDVLLIDVLFVDGRCHQSTVRAGGKAAHLGKDGHITHAGRHQDLLKLLAHTLADGHDVVLGLLRAVRDAHAAGQVDVADMGTGSLLHPDSQPEQDGCQLRVVGEIFCRYNPGGVFQVSNSIMDNPGDAKYGMTKEQMKEAFKLLKEKGAKHFGIHAFLASNTKSNDYYPMLAKIIFELAVELKNELDIHIAFINLSGGVGVPYEPDEFECDIMAIGEGVRRVYEEVLTPAGMGDVAIFTEMGRFMLAPYGALIATAIHEKHTYKEYIGLDACAANLMRPAMYGSYHHITVLGKENAPCDHKYDVTGGLCENNDKFAVDRMLPEIAIGDLLFIHDAGAHGFSMGYNYNGKLRSAEILLQEDGSAKMIRRAETPADYFATFDFGEYGPKLAEEAKIKM
mgnify:CR=1 FL=1